ncbi:MAG: hypothetical protein DWQ04_04440 [Chloroflexi bacterium]|nr:MAG: hypothetical protein DWQ04_04440 [Chloroflexota bacterium]
MKNGDAFNAFLQETQQYLVGLQVITYYAAELPSEIDDRFGTVIARFMDVDADKRSRFLTALNESERALFGIYGHRAATLAARQESRKKLLQGLVGMTIANYTIPEKRRVEVALAVFHHVARKLETSPIELFEDAAVFANDDFAAILLAFSRKPDVTLRGYGWRELKTPDGVKYKFEWG